MSGTTSSRSRLPTKVVRWAIFAHRWLGIPLSPLFVLWFASGAVMLFVPFPSLSDADRHAASPTVDTRAIVVTPERALETVRAQGGLGDIHSLRVVGRYWAPPLYIVEGSLPENGRRGVAGEAAGDATLAVDSVTGELVDELDGEDAARIAQVFRAVRNQATSGGTVHGPFRYDQWVVHQRFDPYRPFFRVRFDDPQATDLYVSARTTEVLQRTTRSERFWNWPGAVTHWIYPTLLRRDWALWDRLVWWLSLVGIVVACLGLTVGLARLRFHQAALGLGRYTPYRGWLRWHHVLGLVGGSLLLTWIVSGWLSMDHGRVFSRPDPEPERLERYRGGSLETSAAQISIEDLARMSEAREIVMTRLATAPVVICHTAGSRDVYSGSRNGALERGAPAHTLLEEGVRRAWPEHTVLAFDPLSPDDVYTHLLEGSLPASTIRFELDDPQRTWVHVDAETGEILNVMDRGRRLNRWLYNGLHSFDFPFLASRPLLRKTIILPGLALGIALSVTSIVIGARRLSKSQFWVWPAPGALPRD